MFLKIVVINVSGGLYCISVIHVLPCVLRFSYILLFKYCCKFGCFLFFFHSLSFLSEHFQCYFLVASELVLSQSPFMSGTSVVFSFSLWALLFVIRSWCRDWINIVDMWSWCVIRSLLTCNCINIRINYLK